MNRFLNILALIALTAPVITEPVGKKISKQKKSCSNLEELAEQTVLQKALDNELKDPEQAERLYRQLIRSANLAVRDEAHLQLATLLINNNGINPGKPLVLRDTEALLESLTNSDRMNDQIAEALALHSLIMKNKTGTQEEKKADNQKSAALFNKLLGGASAEKLKEIGRYYLNSIVEQAKTAPSEHQNVTQELGDRAEMLFRCAIAKADDQDAVLYDTKNDLGVLLALRPQVPCEGEADLNQAQAYFEQVIASEFSSPDQKNKAHNNLKSLFCDDGYSKQPLSPIYNGSSAFKQLIDQKFFVKTTFLKP